jgi:hypothetical protein
MRRSVLERLVVSHSGTMEAMLVWTKGRAQARHFSGKEGYPAFRIVIMVRGKETAFRSVRLEFQVEGALKTTHVTLALSGIASTSRNSFRTRRRIMWLKKR